jgi:hypothetical protein
MRASSSFLKILLRANGQQNRVKIILFDHLLQGVFMKKQLYFFIAALMLGLFSSISSAAMQSFWAYGSSDEASDAKYIQNIRKNVETKSISIDYKIESNWTINSAQLWLRAVDDFKSGHCSGDDCRDVRNGGKNRGGKDGMEKAKISKIEGQKGHWASMEIDDYTWYNLMDVKTYLLADTDNVFSAVLKASRGADFWFKNAKLVIDYDIKAVPLPSAIWLFGSVLLGMTGLKRKSAVGR